MKRRRRPRIEDRSRPAIAHSEIVDCDGCRRGALILTRVRNHPQGSPMRKMAFRSSPAVGFALLLFGCLAAVPRLAAAQDAATGFIQNLGSQALHVLGSGVPP